MVLNNYVTISICDAATEKYMEIHFNSKRNT